MTIWIDADSCPAQVRSILVRAAEREKIPLKFVANRSIPFRRTSQAEMIVVESTPGAADDFIQDAAEKEDMVVTRDIPLAARLLDKEVVVINDRGERFTSNEIRERLSLRNLMEDMRFSGLAADGPNLFGPREVRAFANCFDRELRKILMKRKRQLGFVQKSGGH